MSSFFQQTAQAETFAKKPFYLTAENLCLGFGCREEKMKSDFAGSQLLSNFIIPLLQLI